MTTIHPIGRRVTLILGLFLAFSALAQTTNTAVGSNVTLSPNYGKVPLWFEANSGQADPQVRYYSRGSGYNMFFAPAEMVLALDLSTNTIHPRQGQRHAARMPGESRRESGVLHFSLAGADTNATITAEQAGQQNVHYLLGDDPTQWRTNVPTFGRVRYTAIYPGIDLSFYGNQSRLEYDFVVAPKADPSIIKMVVQGAEGLSIDQDGGLLVRIRQRTLRFGAPIAYQTLDGVRQEVSASFQLDGHSVAFALEIGRASCRERVCAYV
jgi:hypothetical protein